MGTVRQLLTTMGRPLSVFLLTMFFSMMATPTVYGELGSTIPRLSLVPYVTNVNRPVFMTYTEDGRHFVVERGGRIRIVQEGALLDEPFLDIHEQVADYGECGLLSMAFAPDYPTSGVFYVYYSAREDLKKPPIEGEPNGGCDTVVARFRVSNDPNKADPATEEQILVVNQPYFNHNGGQINFGPGGYLYIALGDGGDGGDPHGLAQNPASLLGKMLRIAVASTGAYTIPANNPYVDNPDYRDEIWALGLRNPWRFSFDRETGDLFIGDVGQGRYEEINFQPADSVGGENYGWNIREGDHCYGTTDPCQEDGLVPPIIEYGRTLGSTVTGGYVYRGSAYPGLVGVYLYADYGSDRIWGATSDDSGWESQLFLESLQAKSMVSFAEGKQGELYVIDLDGAIYRVVDLASLPVHVYFPLLINQ